MIDLFDNEKNIELMIINGKKIIDLAIQQYNPIAIMAAYSGGNDSIVSTHFAVENYDAVVVHCETSIGLEKTKCHILNTCEKFKWTLISELPLQEGRPKNWAQDRDFNHGNTPYEDIVLNFGFPGRSQHPRMYQRLKLRALSRVQANFKKGEKRTSSILIISGIRHDESSIRAGYKRDTQKEGSSSRIWCNPFYWNTASDFEAYRQEFGLPRNPVKDIIGISGECLCGSFAKRGEKEAIRSVDPKMGEYLDELERRAREYGFPWGWGESPPKWWMQKKRGQNFLFDMDDEESGDDFRPMCVGCK